MFDLGHGSGFHVNAMGDEYWTAHCRERAGTSRHASQYGMLQPQFRQPDNQVARHEKCRSIQYDTRLHDAIEDDEAYEQATPFDSFGKLTKRCLYKSDTND